jgi:GNAT superfamily N-acetyltransferase
MVFPDKRTFLMKKIVDQKITPNFLGAFAGTKLVGVVGYYQIGDTVRTDGLHVIPAYRNRGVGKELLARVVELNKDKLVWNYTDVSVLPVYQKAGFVKRYPTVFDDDEKKHNCFVVTQS